MTQRPIFVPRFEGVCLVEEVSVEFTWHPGFAPIQKKRNIEELHEAAKRKGLLKILEVSTKSDEKLGVRLSAFNLKVEVPGFGNIPLECAYQGSKVFCDGGPFVDLYTREPREAKRDERLKNLGKLIEFQFGETRWGLEPKTAFYDWLYIKALHEFSEFLQRLFAYNGFSDIEFNPQKSLNCQARSCAILVSLMKKNLLSKAAEDRDQFISILKPDSFAQPHSQDLRQDKLF
jgi:hypothetical protein